MLPDSMSDNRCIESLLSGGQLNDGLVNGIAKRLLNDTNVKLSPDSVSTFSVHEESNSNEEKLMIDGHSNKEEESSLKGVDESEDDEIFEEEEDDDYLIEDEEFESNEDEEDDEEEIDDDNVDSNKHVKKRVYPKHRKSTTKAYACTFEGCTAAFSRQDRLRTHINGNHIQMLRFKCPHCSVSFACQSYLNKHITRSHIRRPQIEADALSNVSWDSLGVIKKGVTCQTCDRVFRRKHHLRSHRANEHGDSLPYNCPVCSKGFSLQWQLKRHLKHHRPKVRKCDHPGCTFQSDKWSALRKHLTTHTKLECSTCFKKFSRFDYLRVHELAKHSSSAPSFACDLPGCSKAYPRESSLRTHQRNSHGEPKYSCEQCGAKFRHKKSLNNHSSKCGKISPTLSLDSTVSPAKKKNSPVIKPNVKDKSLPQPKKTNSVSLLSTARKSRRRLDRVNLLFAQDLLDEADRLALQQADRLLELQAPSTASILANNLVAGVNSPNESTSVNLISCESPTQQQL